MRNYRKLSFYFFAATLLLQSCSDSEIPSISNILDDDQINLAYKIELERTDSGTEPFSTSVNWDSYNQLGFNNYHLFSPSFIDTNIENSTNINFTFLDFQPGEFRDIYVEMIIDTVIYMDSVQVFTRPFLPATDFDIDANTDYQRVLTWTPSLENSEYFLSYNIFKSEDKYDLKNLEECGCMMDTVIISQSAAEFIDTSTHTLEITYYYLLQTNLQHETDNAIYYYYKNSFIPNATYSSLSAVSLGENQVSTNKEDFIEIDWNPITDTGSNFYHYEIWRAEDESLTGKILLATIDDINQTRFTDRYNIGSARTWYYSVAVLDISGRTSFSNYIPGTASP